jgi:hypothetical protein
VCCGDTAFCLFVLVVEDRPLVALATPGFLPGLRPIKGTI